MPHILEDDAGENVSGLPWTLGDGNREGSEGQGLCRTFKKMAFQPECKVKPQKILNRELTSPSLFKRINLATLLRKFYGAREKSGSREANIKNDGMI